MGRCSVDTESLDIPINKLYNILVHGYYIYEGTLLISSLQDPATKKAFVPVSPWPPDGKACFIQVGTILSHGEN